MIDYLLPHCHALITPAVRDEVAVLGANYSDGQEAAKRIAKNLIEIRPLEGRPLVHFMSGYAMGDGERDSIELYHQINGVDALIIDDYLAFIAAVRLGTKTWVLPDFIVQLVFQKNLTLELGIAILNAVRPRYRAGVIEHSLTKLQELKHE